MPPIYDEIGPVPTNTKHSHMISTTPELVGTQSNNKITKKMQ